MVPGTTCHVIPAGTSTPSTIPSRTVRQSGKTLDRNGWLRGTRRRFGWAAMTGLWGWVWPRLSRVQPQFSFLDEILQRRFFVLLVMVLTTSNGACAHGPDRQSAPVFHYWLPIPERWG